MTSDEPEQFSKRLITAHDHLDRADRLLSEVAQEVGAEVSDSLAAEGVDVEYDLDAGAITATLPLDTTIARLNRQLEPPLFATRDGEMIRIADVRDEFGFDTDEVLSDRDRVRSLKEIISTLADSHKEGAPTEKVEALGRALEIKDVEDELEKLRRKGEVYEPRQGHLRTT